MLNNFRNIFFFILLIKISQSKCNNTTSFLLIHMYPFQAWILKHFPRIFSWSYVDNYTEDMPYACAFSMFRRNQTTNPFRVYLDYMVVDDIHLHSYIDHRETRPLKNITFYFGWLACGSRLMYPYLPEHVMPQFRYMQFIPRDTFDSSPPTMALRDVDVDVMYDDYLNHLVLDDTQGTLAPSEWSCAYEVATLYFRLSHHYLTLDTPRVPPRPAHPKILKDEQVRDDHVVDVLHKYRCIMNLAHADINI